MIPAAFRWWHTASRPAIGRNACKCWKPWWHTRKYGCCAVLACFCCCDCVFQHFIVALSGVLCVLCPWLPQYCMSGDSTLEATARAVDDVAKQVHADARYVFVVSDANLRRYNISPARLGALLLSFCVAADGRVMRGCGALQASC